MFKAVAVNRADEVRLINFREKQRIGFMSEPYELNIEDSEFEEKVLHAAGPVMVDFWARWCGSCHLLNPHLEECAREYLGKVKIFKLDVEENPKTSERYEIKSVPTLMFFKNGKLVETVKGALSPASLKERLDKLLGI
jgi:thioredoxin 1